MAGVQCHVCVILKWKAGKEASGRCVKQELQFSLQIHHLVDIDPTAISLVLRKLSKKLHSLEISYLYQPIP